MFIVVVGLMLVCSFVRINQWTYYYFHNSNPGRNKSSLFKSSPQYTVIWKCQIKSGRITVNFLAKSPDQGIDQNRQEMCGRQRVGETFDSALVPKQASLLWQWLGVVDQFQVWHGAQFPFVGRTDKHKLQNGMYGKQQATVLHCNLSILKSPNLPHLAPLGRRWTNY